jgi:hypothetical protein
MAATRRTQLLMDPREFRRLRKVAQRKKTSVAELIRSAVRQVYFVRQPKRGATVEAILRMRLPRISWRSAKKEIESSHAGLS